MAGRQRPHGIIRRAGQQGPSWLGVLILVAALVGVALPRVDALAAATPTFVQVRAKEVKSGTTNRLAFNSANTAGNLIVVYAIWSNTGSVIVSDSWGNSYASAVYYAKNIGQTASSQALAPTARPLRRTAPGSCRWSPSGRRGSRPHAPGRPRPSTPPAHDGAPGQAAWPGAPVRWTALHVQAGVLRGGGASPPRLVGAVALVVPG